MVALFDSRFAAPAYYAIAVPMSPIINSHQSLYDDRSAALHGFRTFVGIRVFAARWQTLEKPEKNEGPQLPVFPCLVQAKCSDFEPAPADGPCTDLCAPETIHGASAGRRQPSG